jgi:hypothetical protein
MILTPNLEPYVGQPDVDVYSQVVLWGGLAYIAE